MPVKKPFNKRRCGWCGKPPHRERGRFVRKDDCCPERIHCHRLWDEEMAALERSMETCFFRPLRNLRDDKGRRVNYPALVRVK